MSHGSTQIIKNICIYCGKKNVKLTDEHIMPYFIGGQHILVNASCKDCADITSEFELQVARNLWGKARTAYNAPSRRKKKRKKYIFIEDAKNIGQKIKIPVDEYPSAMIFYHMKTAGFLLNSPKNFDYSKLWTLKAIHDDKKTKAFEKKYPGQLITKFKHVPDSYARLLEKIAYGQILCSLDPNDFNPICLPYILGKESNHSYIVGSGENSHEPLNDIGYSMRTICIGTSEYLLLIAEIRILANEHTPAYHVVVGDVSGKDNVNSVRDKISATYDVVISDNFKGSCSDEYHWMPRIWPLVKSK